MPSFLLDADGRTGPLRTDFLIHNDNAQTVWHGLLCLASRLQYSEPYSSEVQSERRRRSLPFCTSACNVRSFYEENPLTTHTSDRRDMLMYVRKSFLIFSWRRTSDGRALSVAPSPSRLELSLTEPSPVQSAIGCVCCLQHSLSFL